MWIIVATVLAIAVFAKIVFINEERSLRAIHETILQNAIQTTGIQIANFARAARSYSQLNYLSPGTVISVSNLTSANLLPVGFPVKTYFNQTLEARVGISPSVVVVYATGAPNMSVLSGLSMNASALSNQQSVMQKVAVVTQANLEGVTGAVVGLAAASSLSGSAPYNYIWQPFAGSGILITTYVPSFSVSNPTAVVLFPG